METKNSLHVQGWETSGLILISGLGTFILSIKFHFYTFSLDHPVVSEVVENICCGYSLETPRGGASNEHPQHMLLLRNKKNISSFEYLGFRIDY